MEGHRQGRPAHPAPQSSVKNTLGDLPEELRPLVDAVHQGEEAHAEEIVTDLLSGGALSPENLRPLLDSPHPDLRWWAVRALGDIYHPAAFDALLRALNDPSEDVQQCAALGLRHHALHGLQDEQAQQAIHALLPLLSKTTPLLASLARQALSTIGAPAVQALLDILQHSKDPAARLAAMRALAEIGDQRAIPAMFEAITEGDSALIEYWAETGLENMGVGMSFFWPD